jgi:adenosine kinase
MINQKTKIAVSGSLAYDYIMNFPGFFSQHILPSEIHNLNLSFTLNSLRRSFGGTAGNIAYNLSLLGVKPLIFGVAGFDFVEYRAWLKKQKITTDFISIVKGDKTASAYIITDQADNQLAAFYPGPLPKNYVSSKLLKNKIGLAIISPDDKNRMLAYAALYKKNGVPYIFDPGQALIAYSAAELKKVVFAAEVLIGNDYEIKVLLDKLKLSLSELTKKLKILIITKGSQGSEIYSNQQKITIKPAKPKNTSDPTGAGDAYRAGFIKGLISGLDLKSCGQLGGLVSVYTVEKAGTQTHSFTKSELLKRYQKNYQEKLYL